MGTDSPQCTTGKCDDPSAITFGQLMPRAPQAPGTISVTRNDSSWLCEVIGDQGEIVLLSDEYAGRTSALNGVLAIEENGVLADRYRVSQTTSGWSFELRAANNVLLADSQSFATEQEARDAVAATRDLVAGIVQYKAVLQDGAQFVLTRDGSEWEFLLRDQDGGAILKSQVYQRRSDAINGIESVRENGKNDARYQIVDSPPRVILKAANGQEIAESNETFDSVEAAEAAIASTQTLLSSERVANPW
jgi:uncharacterized protein YegP (UPF0339 family)